MSDEEKLGRLLGGLRSNSMTQKGLDKLKNELEDSNFTMSLLKKYIDIRLKDNEGSKFDLEYIKENIDKIESNIKNSLFVIAEESNPYT